MSGSVSGIAVRITGDNTDFKNTLNDSSKAASSLVDKLEHRIVGTRHLAGALATALGLNIEKIAENLARAVTGFSKEEEEAFKKLEQASTELADITIKNMRANLSDEQRYQLAIADRERALKQLNEVYDTSGKTQLARTEALIRAGKAEEVMHEIERKRAEETARAEERAARTREQQSEKEIAAAVRMRDAQIAALKPVEQIAFLKEDIAQAELLIQSGLLEEKIRNELINQVADKRLKLFQEEIRLKKEAAEADKKNAAAELEMREKEADSARSELSLNEQKKKIQGEIKTLAAEIVEGEKNHLDVSEKIQRVEQLRGELRSMEKEQAKDNVRLAELLLKGKENLTDQEKIELSILQGQTTQLKINAEIAGLTAKLIDGSITPAEKQRLEVLIGQSHEIHGQLADLKEQEQTIIRIANRSDGRGNDKLTDAELREKIQNLNSQIFAAQSTSGSDPVFQQLALASLRQQLNPAQKELEGRIGFRNEAAAFGEERALGLHSAFDRNRLQGYLRDPDALSKITTGITELNQRLENSGLFPAMTVSR